MKTEITIIWHDGNEYIATHGYIDENFPHGVVNINDSAFPESAEIMATICGHVTVHWKG